MKTVNHFSELDGGSTGQSNLGVFNTEQPVENTERFDLGSNRDGTVTAGAIDPTVPTQKTTLGKFIPGSGSNNNRIKALENAMVQVVDGINGINARLDKLPGNQ